jgi:DNA-binding NarL/FixJ family response regulator
VASSNSRSPEINKLKVLIVEDNAFFRNVFKDTLQRLFPSMVIEEAADANKVLQKVDTFLPNLIFMDIRLPGGGNGLQLTKKIRASHPDISVVIVTNHDIPEYREAAVQYGAKCFLPKDSLKWGEIETLIISF